MVQRNRHILRAKQHLFQYRMVRRLNALLRRARGFPVSEECVGKVEDVDLEWIDGVKKPHVGIVKDALGCPNSYWPKFEHFLEHNDVTFGIYNPHSSNWMTDAKPYDILVWRPDYSLVALEEETEKIQFLETKLGKFCYPSFANLWIYVDKVKQFYMLQHLGVPIVPTFISYDRNEIEAFLKRARFPIVTKIRTGAGSAGVELLQTEGEAKKMVKKVFGTGRSTYWIDLKQKGYVYFQEFVCDATYDLRVIVIGDKVFGFYRMCPGNDFRASGAGLIVRAELPEDAMRIAIETTHKLDIPMLAVDMVYSTRTGKHLVIEASQFIRIDTPCEETFAKGNPGYYRYDDSGRIVFTPGRYWIQEFALKEILHRWRKTRSGKVA